MKRLTLLLIALGLTLGLPLRAQITHTPTGSHDEAAAKLLKKAARKLGNVSMTVKVNMQDAVKREVGTYEAQVSRASGGYRVKMKGQEIVCDGKTVWQWNKSDNEVVINSLAKDDGTNPLNPGDMIANHEKYFRAKFIRTESDGTAVIDMQPNKAQSYHKIRLLIDSKNGELKQIEVHKFDSGREIYEFTNRNYGTVKETFAFDPKKQCPKAEIIDMR